MIDRFGRKIDYLRISVTDRCNLRCRYCMPENGITPVPHSEILTYDELFRLAEIFSELGIRKIKLTGGEPLVRKDFPALVKGLKETCGIEEVTLTTNGVLLAEKAVELWEAGIDGINISLDTLDPVKYEKITGQDVFYKVLDGIDSALNFNIRTRINTVTLKGFNYDEICDLAGMAYSKPLDVRFIEMMPIGLGSAFEGYGTGDILEKLTAEFGEPVEHKGRTGNGPADYYRFKGFKGNIGLIGAVTHAFCSECNKIRLTSTGGLKTCLQYEAEADLKKPLREGNREEVRKLILDSMANKPESHEFSVSADSEAEKSDHRKCADNSMNEIKETAGMSQIGG